MKALSLDCEYAPIQNVDCLDNQKGSTIYKNPRFNYIDYHVPPLHSDEVLIRVLKVGLCGSDIHCFETNENDYILFSGPSRFPQILGHEFAGYIEKTGEHVPFLKKGDYVACESVLWCGHCLNCRKGYFSECSNVELVGLTTGGAFRDYIIMPHHQVWRIDSLMKSYELETALELGTLLEPLGCAYKGLNLMSKNFNYLGATAAVYGAGPIGLGAAWLLKENGASKVYVFEINPYRIELAKSLGFKDTIDARNIDSISEFLLNDTNGRGIDVSVECSGDANRLFPDIIESSASRSMIVYLSRTGSRNFSIDFDTVLSKGLTIIGSRGHSGTFSVLMNILANPGSAYIKDFITDRVRFEDLKNYLEKGTYKNQGKVIINFC